MKLISWNVNGLRSVCRQNFLTWLEEAKPDIIALQEIKASVQDLPPALTKTEDYHLFFKSAQKKGYAGTAIFSKKPPERIKLNIGLKEFDEQGRFLELEFESFKVLNVYMPHGGRQKEKLPFKLKAYDYFLNYLKKEQKPLILTGDFNIAHEDIDLARPKQNRNNIMFTLEERSLIDRLLSLGYTDTFREFCGKTGFYTWWPYMAKARERNIGWRIDYIFTDRRFKNLINARILSNVYGSDHCPVELEMNF